MAERRLYTVRFMGTADTVRGRGVQLSNLPGHSDAPFGGGGRFVSHCLVADMRARHRRNAIKRAQTALARAEKRSENAYPAALVCSQRLGVALEDLGRLAIGIEAIGSEDAFDAMRSASLEDIGSVFDRLRNEAALRRALKIPRPDDLAELDAPLRDAALAAADLLARRWHRQWCSCAAGWPLLQRIAKGARHGSPLIQRETVIEAPGAGALGEEAADLFDRWVLVLDTRVDNATKAISTTWLVADLSSSTLARAAGAVIDGIALAQKLAEAHAGRVTAGYKWVFPNDILRALEPRQRQVLREALRHD